jgi:uncharacterized membrane protein YsdA (DUF1294 family)
MNRFFRQLLTHPSLRTFVENNRNLSITIGAYIIVVNVGAAGVFYYDKQQAIHHKWRVPEKTLCLTGLMGGWIGGVAAMEAFKHKRSKPSFLQKYYAAVCVNVLCVAALAFFAKRRAKLPPTLQPVQTMPQRFTKETHRKQKDRFGKFDKEPRENRYNK